MNGSIERNKHMRTRPYASADDLARLQHFNAQQIARDPVGWLEPGDIPHRLYGRLRAYNPSEMLRLWEDDAGTILGWALAQPPDTFDIQSADSQVIAEALAWVEPRLSAATFRAHGYAPDPNAAPYAITWRSLHEPLPDPRLPDGFTVRAAQGLGDAAPLADVHNRAFNATWTAESYATYMQAPGYAAEREFVAVAPDGRFGAFTVTWHDTINRTGYFEPVGTHPDFRRLGLASAVMTVAMQRMRAHGLEHAIVVHEPVDKNPASAALYASLGFVLRFSTDLYKKTRPHPHP
jgi:mycothiol synthase